MLKFRTDNRLLLITSDCLVELSKDTLSVCINGSSIESKIPDEIQAKMTPRRMKLFKGYVYDVICNPERTIRLPELYPPDYSDYIDLDMLTKSAYSVSKALLLKELYSKIEQHLFGYCLSYPLYDDKLDRREYLFDVHIETHLAASITSGTIDGIYFSIGWLSTADRLLASVIDPYRKAMESFPKEL